MIGDTDEAPQAVSGVLCVACGYDLTGLSTTTNCPECGTPVRDSENPMLMRYSDAESLGRVRVGLRLIFWKSIIVFVIVIALLVTYGLDEQSAVLVATYVVGVASLSLSLFGWMLVTHVLHRMPQQQKLGQLRFWIVVLLLGSGCLNMFESFLEDFASVSWSVPVAVIWIVVSVTLFTMLEMSKLAYMKRLAMFVPDWKLASRFAFLTRVIFWTMMLSSLSFLGLGAFDSKMFTNPEQLYTQGGVVGVLYTGMSLIAGAILALCYYLPFLVYLYKLGNRVTDAFGFASQRAFAKHYTEAPTEP